MKDLKFLGPQRIQKECNARNIRSRVIKTTN